MGAFLSGVVPKAFGGIKVRRIGGQREHLEVAVMFGKELQNFGLFVKRGVVLNQIHAMAAAIKMRQQFFIHERQVSFGVEVFGLVPPDKIAGGHADRPQDLLGVAFAAGGDLRLLTAARPRAIERIRVANPA